jgi:MoaA/NifB/PqqE/SkfB family radical SAM enzyme
MRRETAYEGYVDRLEEKTLFGWCYKKDEPNKSIQLDIYINDRLIKSITASEFREDLLKAGIGNGKYSFKYNVANYIDQYDQNYIINVKVSGTDIDLAFSPILVKNSQQITHKCYFPWNNLHIRASGEVDTCQCPSWLGSQSYSIGNINKQSYDELWNGSKIRQYREAFLKGNHKKFCRMHICPYLNGTSKQESTSINVLKAISNQNTYLDFDPTSLDCDIDEGCNLKCTICRENIKVVNKKAVQDAVSIMKKIASGGNLQSITTSGAGETFLFDEFVDLLRSDFLSSRGITLNLITNLTIFTPKLWEEIRHNDIVLSVSVDGATKETYESIRRGAKWESVYQKLLYLSNLLDKGEIKTVNLACVITLGNAHEVDKIIELAKKLGFTLTFLSHRGRLPTKWDNIFESCNIEKLDMIYNLIEKADGFNMPKVFLASCGMIKNREYRQFRYRMEMAEYQIREYDDKEIAKHIVQKCLNDINNGIIEVQQSQLTNYRNFILSLGC